MNFCLAQFVFGSCEVIRPRRLASHLRNWLKWPVAQVLVVPSSFVCSCSCFTVPCARVCLNPRSVCRRLLVFMFGVRVWLASVLRIGVNLLTRVCVLCWCHDACLHYDNPNKEPRARGYTLGRTGRVLIEYNVIDTPLPRELAYFSSYTSAILAQGLRLNIFPTHPHLQMGICGARYSLGGASGFHLEAPTK